MNSGNGTYAFSVLKWFWYWTQVGLVGLMILTGFEIHGAFTVFGYDTAISMHKFGIWGLLYLTPLTILGGILFKRRIQCMSTTNRISLFVGLVVLCLQVATGTQYITYNNWALSDSLLSLPIVAYAHTLGAFVVTAYMIVQIYLACFATKLNSTLKRLE